MDINKFWIGLITFYQRFISPYKGFHCAHHARHQSGTCSNAVKDLIADNGFFNALPLIRIRFKECRIAYEAIKVNTFTSDLPCVDASCVGDLFSCGGDAASSSAGSEVCDCFGFIYDIIDWKKRSKKGKRLIVIIAASTALILAYLFYGRSIANVMITDLGVQHQNLFKRISQREHPEVRVLLIVKGEKIYSEIVTLDQTNKAYKLSLNKPLKDFQIEQIQILDARLSVGKALLVLGQELEVFEYPKTSDQGRRFKYRLKRRWHF